MRFTVTASAGDCSAGNCGVAPGATEPTLFRDAVDAALLVQSAAVSKVTGVALPPEYSLPGVDEMAEYPTAGRRSSRHVSASRASKTSAVANETIMEDPEVPGGDHSGPAPGSFQVLMRNISALPPCPNTPTGAFAPRAPGDCLRRLALAEQQGCPACWTNLSDPGLGSICDTTQDLYNGVGAFANSTDAYGRPYRGAYTNNDPSLTPYDAANDPQRPVLGPRAPQTWPSSDLFNKACINTTGLPASPARVLMGEATVDAITGRITPFPHPYMTMANETAQPSAQFIALSSTTASGRVYGGEYWCGLSWLGGDFP